MIISETIQAMPVKFSVTIVRLKAYMTIASPVTVIFTKSHKCVSNLTNCAFKLYMTVDLCIAYYIYAHAHFDDLELDLDFEKRLKGVSLLVCPRCLAAPSVTPEGVSRYRARIELSVMDVTPTSALMEWDFTGLDPRYVQLFELKVKSRSNFTLLTESLKPNLNVMDLSLQPGLYDERVYYT